MNPDLEPPREQATRHFRRAIRLWLFTGPRRKDNYTVVRHEALHEKQELPRVRADRAVMVDCNGHAKSPFHFASTSPVILPSRASMPYRRMTLYESFTPQEMNTLWPSSIAPAGRMQMG